MTTFIAGTDLIVQLDNASDTLTNISDDVSNANVDVAYVIGTFYTFGLTGAQNTEGQRTFTGALGIRSGKDDATAGHRLCLDWLAPGSGTKAGARSLRIEHPDAASGSYRFDMEIRATGYGLFNSDAGGDGTPSANSLAFNVDGDVTYAVIV